MKLDLYLDIRLQNPNPFHCPILPLNAGWKYVLFVVIEIITNLSKMSILFEFLNIRVHFFLLSSGQTKRKYKIYNGLSKLSREVKIILMTVFPTVWFAC